MNRADDIIDLCEIKWSLGEYTIDKTATLGGKYPWQDFHLQELCHARHTKNGNEETVPPLPRSQNNNPVPCSKTLGLPAYLFGVGAVLTNEIEDKVVVLGFHINLVFSKGLIDLDGVAGARPFNAAYSIKGAFK